MAPRPLTSIFMAPPPPSRLTASGVTSQSGSGPTTPTYNAAFPGFPVTTLPEGGISIIVPPNSEPESKEEPEPKPVWMPKARQGLGIGTVGKSSVWDGMAPMRDSVSVTSSRPTSRNVSAPKGRSHTSETAAWSDTDALSDSGAMPKKRHVPRNPLDPHRLALISNALGVSMPIPPRSVLQARIPEDRARKASLDDARLVQNHVRTTSLASFRSSRASPTPAHLRSSPSLSTMSRRPLASASSASFSFTTPSQPTRFLLHVYPPPHMPSVHPFASLSPPPGYHSQFRRGTLVALHASLPGQLSAIAKEYGLPSATGMCVYLLSADYEPPEEDDDYPLPRDERALGPRIGEEAWKMLWAALLKSDRDEMIRSFNPGEGSVTSSPASGLTTLAGEESPPPPGVPSLSPKSSNSSFAPRPLRTVVAVNSREGFKGIGMGGASGPGQTPLSATSPSSGTASTALSRNPSLATTQSRTSSPTTTLSTNPTTTVSIMPTLPIVGKIEFDIDMRRAPWYETFCQRAHQQLGQRRLPSRVNTPVGPLATPAPRGEAGSPSPITLTLPPRARSASPGPDGSTLPALFPRSASPSSSSKFPMHLQLPSNPANRNDHGLLSPKDALTTFTSGSSSEWPTDDETVAAGSLGLQLSPSSSTVADGTLTDVVAEGGYEALGDEEDTSNFDESSMLEPGADPLGDVFPDEPWNASTRAIKGIEDLPPTRNEEVDDESGELPPIDPSQEVSDVLKLWNETDRPSLALSPPGEPAAFVRPTDPSAVVFPRPAPARQRSDSNKRPPPLKLGSTDDVDKLSDQNWGQEHQAHGDENLNTIVVTGEDGEADWTWRSSEHIRKERLDELEKALAQLSPRILEPPPPEFDRPRSPGLHHRMLSNGTLRAGGARPDPHAPLFMSEELSNLRASMAAKNGNLTPNNTPSAQASPSWQASGSGLPGTTTPGGSPMTSETRIRMQTEQMRLDLANLPPPGSAPPRPRRPQTPVALNSPPMEDSPPVPSHQRSRFSLDSNGDEVVGLAAPNRERANSIMSVKGIKKLWRGRNSTQNLNGKGPDMPPVPPSPGPGSQTLGPNRDSQMPPPGTPPTATLPLAAPTHKRQTSQPQPAQVAAVKSGTHKRDSSNSGKDPFHFDQESRYPVRSHSPSYLSDMYPPPAPPSLAAAKEKDKEKEKATTKSILKKWSSKTAKKPDGELDSAPSSRPESRLSPRKGPLNGLGGHSARGSVSSVHTLTGAQSSNNLQADMPSRPSVSSSLTSDVEPMTPRMSQFEMVVPAQNQS